VLLPGLAGREEYLRLGAPRGIVHRDSQNVKRVPGNQGKASGACQSAAAHEPQNRASPRSMCTTEWGSSRTGSPGNAAALPRVPHLVERPLQGSLGEERGVGRHPVEFLAGPVYRHQRAGHRRRAKLGFPKNKSQDGDVEICFGDPQQALALHHRLSR